MPLTTRCARCGRLFPVYAQELKARRGRVNCPQCGARFDGLAALLDESIPGLEPSASRVWTAAPPLAGIGAGIRAGTSADGGAGARGNPTRRARLARLGWAAGCLALLLALGAQWLWWQRDDLLRDPRGHRLVADLCAPLGCTPPVPRVDGALAVVGPSLSPHPAGGGALALRLGIENRAPVPQPAPLLELTLLDREGELAANRRFAPREYAPGSPATLAPGETRAIGLDLAAPPVETSGFKVRLQ